MPRIDANSPKKIKQAEIPNKQGSNPRECRRHQAKLNLRQSGTEVRYYQMIKQCILLNYCH